MKIVGYLDALISNNLLQEQLDSTRHRELRGRLSGSILGSPLQEQILHILGIPEKQIDPYTLRKFKRGQDVEDWVMSQMPGLVGQQGDIEYRGATGHLDGEVDMSLWEDPDLQELGIIPHEIKSITNAAFKWLLKRPVAKWHHSLQAGMYAMARGKDHFMIHYIASDDYRIFSMLYDINEIDKEHETSIRQAVDDVISEVSDQIALGKIPAFQAREPWQDNSDYQKYPTWATLTEDECMSKIQLEYPDAYNRLISLSQKAKGGEE